MLLTVEPMEEVSQGVVLVFDSIVLSQTLLYFEIPYMVETQKRVQQAKKSLPEGLFF